jgi:ubiquinone/menaquinone biosynthesis C-methylase UbiE
MELRVPPLDTCLDPLAVLSQRPDLLGVVVALDRGWPGSSHLRFVARALAAGRRAWFYWPSATTLEVIDAAMLQSYRTLWRITTAGQLQQRLAAIVQPPKPTDGSRVIDRCADALRDLHREAHPVPFPPAASAVRSGTGIYFRADYWQDLTGGRAYEHAGLVARELAASTEDLTCLVASRVAILDESGIRQVVMQRASDSVSEIQLLAASVHYAGLLEVACSVRRPSYIYEPLCLGSFAGAEVSRKLGIPYVAEYRGSDHLASGTFNGMSLEHAQLLTRAEEAAFKQATAIVVPSDALKEKLVARKVNARRILVNPEGAGQIDRLWRFVADLPAGDGDGAETHRIDTGDADKERVQDQWDLNPVGSHYVSSGTPFSREWFEAVERHRYGTYAPWMPGVMEFSEHSGHDVLEIGAGMGTDLSQFAKHGARVTDLDLSSGHLELARRNFAARGLDGRFVHHDAETLPFPDGSFDLIYSNGVLHHSPNTSRIVDEIWRVLKPGGRAIIMMYAEHSIYYWREMVWRLGIKQGLLEQLPIGEIMSRYVEISQNDARPLVKVYSAARLRSMFARFESRRIYKRQLVKSELPGLLAWMPVGLAERMMGWNLIIKARKASS